VEEFPLPGSKDWQGQGDTSQQRFQLLPPFVARVDSILEEAASRYSRFPNGAPYTFRDCFVDVTFVAPFEKRNKLLILSGAPIELRGDEARVLIDMALDQGLVLNTDFDFIKLSNHIKVKSPRLRTFLVESMEKWVSFEMILVVRLPIPYRTFDCAFTGVAR